MKEKWIALFKDHRSLAASTLLSLLFFLFYQVSLNHLSFGIYKTRWYILPNASALWNRSIAPFLWEPIAVIQFPGLQWFLSPLNLLLGLLCRLDQKPRNPLLRILPAFLTGLACCAPAFLIPLASLAGSFTLFFIKARIFFVPLTLLFLGYGIIRGFKHMIIQES